MLSCVYRTNNLRNDWVTGGICVALILPYFALKPGPQAYPTLSVRGGTIPEITMRYVSRYLSHDTIRITILIDYQAKIKEA